MIFKLLESPIEFKEGASLTKSIDPADGSKTYSLTKKDSKVKTYIVEKGDTLYSLSRKFNVSVLSNVVSSFNELW